MIRRALILALLGLLAGCASSPPAEPKVVTKEVQVAVPVSCVPKDAPLRPAFTDTKAARRTTPNAAADYQLLAGNWPLHQAYESALEAIVGACR